MASTWLEVRFEQTRLSGSLTIYFMKSVGTSHRKKFCQFVNSKVVIASRNRFISAQVMNIVFKI